MKYLSAMLPLLFLSPVSASATADTLQLGSLALELPPGWQFRTGQQRVEGKGPDGQILIANFRSLPAGAAQQGADMDKLVAGFASDQMPLLASKGKQVVRALEKTDTGDGYVRYSAVSQSQRMLRDYYFLQYLFGAPQSMAYVTIEGYGDAAQAAARFDSVAAWARWDAAVASGEKFRAPLDKAAVRLVLRSRAYLANARKMLGATPQLAYRSLAGSASSGLVVVPVLDTAHAVRPLDDRDMSALGLELDQLIELGERNMRATLKPLQDKARPVGPGQIGSLPRDFFEVGRVAMHADWAPLATAQQGVLLVAVPTTDALLYISEDSPAAIDALGALAREMAAGAPNPLSGAVLQWTSTGWRLARAGAD